MIVYFIAPNELGRHYNARFDRQWLHYNKTVRRCVGRTKEIVWAQYLALIYPHRGVSRMTQACSLERVP